METFLILNGFEIDAEVDDAEAVILSLASGNLAREELQAWVASHICSVANYLGFGVRVLKMRS